MLAVGLANTRITTDHAPTISPITANIDSFESPTSLNPSTTNTCGLKIL